MNDDIAILILVITGLIALIYGLTSLSDWVGNKKREKELAQIQKEVEEESEKEWAIYDRQLKTLEEKYGEPTRQFILFPDYLEYEKRCIYIFETERKIFMNNSCYDFKDIIGYSLHIDNQMIITSSTSSIEKTNTGNLLGRTIGGAVIGGGLGAVIGGVSASRSSEGRTVSETTSRHNYILYVKINSISNPLIPLDFTVHRESAEEFATILDIIIASNKSE